MMVRFFNRAFPIQYISLVMMIIIFWSFSFLMIHKIATPKPTDEIAFLSTGLLLKNHFILSTILAMILLLLQAFFFNYFLNINNIIPKNSLAGFFTFILFMSFNGEFYYLSNLLIAQTFILILLFLTFKIYMDPKEYQLIFNMGFMLSLATFFYFPALYLIFFIWTSFFIFRIGDWRSWIIVLFGILTPYLFYFTYLFWTENWNQPVHILHAYFADLFPLDFQFSSHTTYYIAFGTGMFIIILSVIHLITNFFDQVIVLRKNMAAILAFLFYSLLIFILHPNISILLSIVPASIIVSFFISRVKNSLILDTLLFIFMLAIVINNIFLVTIG